jgi:hypothetical protein
MPDNYLMHLGTQLGKAVQEFDVPVSRQDDPTSTCSKLGGRDSVADWHLPLRSHSHQRAHVNSMQK